MGGMTRLLLLLWAGVTLTTALDLQKRIYGGATCKPTERHYHVKLLDDNNNFICGGSLIAPQWILTAAHCWKEYLQAVLKVHQGPAKIVEIKAAPRMYEDSDMLHDIMLLKLPTPVSGITHIPQPRCVTGNTIKKGDVVQIAGHGPTVTEPDESATLQCANIKVVDCSSTDPAVVSRSHQHIFCGFTTGKDAGYGDSGGGVVYMNKIYGVISFTCDAQTACNKPAGFMDVCKYTDWIRETIAIPKTTRV